MKEELNKLLKHCGLSSEDATVGIVRDEYYVVYAYNAEVARKIPDAYNGKAIRIIVLGELIPCGN